MLKGRRHYGQADSEISYFMVSAAAQGIIVSYPTGAIAPPALDDADNFARIPAAKSEQPLGLLLDAVVSRDLTKDHLNCHKRETNIGGKVEIARRGWFITDQITGADPSAGDKAYFDVGGLLTIETGSLQVGVFESDPDADGFVRVHINI